MASTTVQEAGSNFKVTVKVGNPGIQGPKGDTGDVGPKGDTGLTGPQGEIGDIGPQGIQGIQGISPYEAAVRNGYVGTEEEWLTFIRADGSIQALQQFMTNNASTNVDVPAYGEIPSLQGYVSTMFEEGKLTTLTEQAIRDKLKLNIFDDDVPLMFALADANGYFTDLQIDDEGKIPNRVLEQWNARLKAMNGGDVVLPPVTPNPTPSNNTGKLDLVHTLPVLSTTLTSIHQADSHYRNGELLPVMPDRNKVILIGSSSIEKSRTLITNELKTLNASVQVLNVGYSGATIEQQEVSVGNKPMRIRITTGKINKSGDTLLVNVDKYKTSAYTSSITGWINGVLGKLKVSGSNLYFTRAGTAATDTEATGDLYFIPDKGNEYRNAIQILWLGKNNLTSTDPAVNNVMQLLDKTDHMIENSASLIKRVVVMTHWNDTDVPAVSAERDRINQCNHLYKLRYKENVFDVESYILGSQIFTDLNITRTQADIDAQSIGNLPPSLAADRVHATSAVYAYLVSKLKDFINNKNYLGV